ncbi:MAG: MOSC domain-containing protein [Planctomycetota bacterium]|jgi:MOSC domain-containing protein YiiM
MARIEKIWIKRGRGAPMDPADNATLVAGAGLLNCANQGGKRQVTFISAERWAVAQKELDAEVDPVSRRANVLVSGLDLVDSRGKTLCIGDCRIEIHGETRPCELMDKMHEGLQAALDADWGGGCYGTVETGGAIAVGDEIDWQ